ncbi:fluoride efflux transporter CrcB [Phormidium sp. LEGE 05292]|uniref:fluoride efflux transporter CrcB n=1 Tax=[Phormidium] sp. LEGE 05292 TaxID=767427 RepID=UPI001880CC8B|nr:fluoride efflux transporter CrcB [Phormidium sp. LEGE 05292]MBE9229416.1 fluoride efflux transporter CrcB [Phormidium sp. LEGE 05292]
MLLPQMLQDPNFRTPLAISLGAIAGALSRYYITLYFLQRFGSNFPFGTFFVNLTGCFAMGFFVTLASQVINIPPELRLLATTGFLGAYTTFSTYGLDTMNIWDSGNYSSAIFYWLGSAILGILCLQIGVILAKLL